MEKTGTWSVPGCGRASGTGGTRFTDGDLSRSSVGLLTAGAKHAPEDVSAVGGGEDVADRGPVLIACGQGQSMYDVKGCLSSWALVGSSHYREPRDKGLAGGKGGGGGSSKGRYGGEGVGDKTSDRHGNAGGLELGADSWTLRSKPTAAGDGGVMCSACVPFSEYGEVLGSRMLITGGKDSVLREWEVVDGRPRLSAEIPGHTDWISCCSLVPSTTSGMPPTVAVSGGRDGSVRIWSKSVAHLRYSTSFVHQNVSNFGDGFSKRGGSGGGGGDVGTGGWSQASCLSSAHGSSEFVTCSACPGDKPGAAAGWVATGGTDWTVRLWDVEKMRELGRLSFRGHSRQVTSLAASPDGNLLVSGGEDNKVIVWSPQSRRAVATLKGHESTVKGVAIAQETGSGNSPGWVASGGGEGSLFVWDPRNWRSPVATLLGESPHGASAAAGGLTGLSLDASGRLFEGAAARYRGESGRWEGDTTGTTMLNSVNCLAAGRAGDGVDWLFGAGETTIRAWRMCDGIWYAEGALPGGGLGGVSSMSVWNGERK
ncbi:unnamed protein product [Ascophyllum nodosum]